MRHGCIQVRLGEGSRDTFRVYLLGKLGPSKKLRRKLQILQGKTAVFLRLIFATKTANCSFINFPVIVHKLSVCVLIIYMAEAVNQGLGFIYSIFIFWGWVAWWAFCKFACTSTTSARRGTVRHVKYTCKIWSSYNKQTYF